MEYDDIREFLRDYIGKEIFYIPNEGNAGDTLIAYGTIQLFNELGINWTMKHSYTKFHNKILFYGGGGNLVKTYSDARNFLIKNKDNNEIVILPHTIKDEDKLIQSFDKKIKVFCRESTSYEYVKKMHPVADNVFLSKDLAFYINIPQSIKNVNGTGIANCMRIDVESTKKHKIHEDNNDISRTLNKKGNTSDIATINSITLNFFEYLSRFETVNTDRLHVGIAASLLGKKVNLYDNSYYKVRSVYEYSIKYIYPNTTMMD
jgi:exopolysaccharide biosynthesis predicted pyruvyltransferase EpsI